MFIETLCSPIDDLLGGGVESGILTHIYGVAGSGKTSIALQCALNCIFKGWKAIFIDADCSFSRRRFLQISSRFEAPDLSRFILLSPRSFIDQSDMIDSIEILAREGVRLIAFDSVGSLYRYSVGLDREQNAHVNMELCRQMAMLLHVAKEFDLVGVILNQARGGPIKNSEAEFAPVATQVIEPWCNVQLRLERVGEPPHRRVFLEKHYSRPTGSSAEFSISELGAS